MSSRGAERGGDQRLGFAAGEDGGAVGAGQNADFDPDGADLVEGAAIGTALVRGDLLAEDSLAQSLRNSVLSFCGLPRLLPE